MGQWKVYKLTNLTSGKSYIGITSKPLDIRLKEHIDDAIHSRKLHKNGTRYAIHAAIMKYGAEKFSIEVIQSNLMLDQARQQETITIRKYNTFAGVGNLPNMPRGYNETMGGEIPDPGDVSHARFLEEKTRNQSIAISEKSAISKAGMKEVTTNLNLGSDRLKRQPIKLDNKKEEVKDPIKPLTFKPKLPESDNNLSAFIWVFIIFIIIISFS